MNEITRTDLLELDLPSASDTSEGYTSTWAPPAPAAPTPEPEPTPTLPLNPAAARIAAVAAGGRAQAREAAIRAVAPAPVVTSTPLSEVGTVLAAGARAVADGRLVSWTGQGPLTLGATRDALREAGLPEEWAPRPVSLHGHLGRVLYSRATRAGLVCRVVHKHRGARWRARWQLGTISGGDVGAPFGSVRHVVTLTGDAYEITAPEGDVAAGEWVAGVRDEVAQLLRDESLISADVTAWLDGVLRRRLGALRLGTSYYLPGPSADDGERLCAALQAQAWGQWMLPAIPVVTSLALGTSLARSALGELAEVEADAAALKGARGATAAIRRAEEIRDRARALSPVLGEAQAQLVETTARAAIERLQALLGGARAAVLELD